MNITFKIDVAISAVAPIHGVSIGNVDDKKTWRIDFKDEATPEQRAAAQAVIEAFDPVAAVRPDYRQLRLEAYRARGANETACIEAIIEAMGGRPEKMNALAVIRDSVHRDFPKEP